jgi:hypothetical protein
MADASDPPSSDPPTRVEAMEAFWRYAAEVAVNIHQRPAVAPISEVELQAVDQFIGRVNASIRDLRAILRAAPDALASERSAGMREFSVSVDSATKAFRAVKREWSLRKEALRMATADRK